MRQYFGENHPAPQVEFNAADAIAAIYAAKLCRRRSNLAYLLEWMCDAVQKRYTCKVHYYKVTPGKWYRVEDYRLQVTAAAELLGLKIEFGNDAPRGGKTGDFVIVSI